IYARLPITLTYNANYFETIKFLDRLENFPRIVDVKDLKLNPAGDDKETVNVTMSMFTYVLRKGTQ
ncbi:MAG TPA: type 4a pilus biogenesis protein PilO, partial [Atribacterota bacterium]|nr:type 4a pilus biogenesis protein PilO [Atribacterota bacterium]